jgi:hypothetical protein
LHPDIHGQTVRVGGGRCRKVIVSNDLVLNAAVSPNGRSQNAKAPSIAALALSGSEPTLTDAALCTNGGFRSSTSQLRCLTLVMCNVYFVKPMLRLG